MERPKDFGTIPPLWSKEGWIDHLRHMAEACRNLRPERAEMYEDWARSLQDAETDSN